MSEIFDSEQSFASHETSFLSEREIPLPGEEGVPSTPLFSGSFDQESANCPSLPIKGNCNTKGCTPDQLS